MPEKSTYRRVETAVILAAGMGTRLFNGGITPKPLLTLVGLPIIERVMATAAKAGICRFVVVIGYQSGLMRTEIPRLLPSGCDLSLIENPRFEASNGLSLLAALTDVSEPFVLLMSDHLFSPDRLSLALTQHARTGRCLLVVEDKDEFDGDIEDATRVTVDNGRVDQIDKGLARYDAIDTGMFVLHPDRVLSVLNRCGASPSISDGMRRLAADGDLDAYYMTSGFWQDIDTPEDLKAAERKLYKSLTRATDGFLARLINRRISLFFSTRIWRFGITPNMVTGFTLVLGLLSGVAFGQGGGAGWGLLGATLFQLQSVIDGVDGELARLMHKETPFGFWFDISVDNISHMAVFGGIAVGHRIDHVPGPWGFLGLLSIFGVAASFAVMAPLLKPRPDHPPLKGDDNRLKRLVDTLSRRDFTYLLFPLAVLGWLGGFLWVAAAGTWLFTLAVIVLRCRSRRVTASDTNGKRP